MSTAGRQITMAEAREAALAAVARAEEARRKSAEPADTCPDCAALRAELAAAKAEGEQWQNELFESRQCRRMNITRDGDALLVCDGVHDKSQACYYERFVPEAEAARLREASFQGLQVWCPRCRGQVVLMGGCPACPTCGAEFTRAPLDSFLVLPERHASRSAVLPALAAPEKEPGA